MNVWAILRNLGLVISFFKSFQGLVSEMVKTKAPPGIEAVKEFLDKAEALLNSGAIDIPGVDEKQIADALQQIEEQLCPK